MYGIDTHYVGPQHFNKLRRATVEAFIGNKPHGSTWLALTMLSKYIMDPLLFVILSICRLLRRCFTYHPQLVMGIVQRASSFQGKRAYGPASSFRKYLDLVSWSISPDGKISGQGFPKSTNCLHSSTKELTRDMKRAFGIFVYQQVSHRKGLGQVTWNIPDTIEVFSKFPEHNQAILANHIIGGFQNEVKKSKWDMESSNRCPLCQQVDDQRHRFLDCVHFANIREIHKEAIHILEQVRPKWIYHPVTYQSEETSLIEGVLHAIPPVESINQVVTSTSHHRYFTDGACENPTHTTIRRSAWAVVQDFSEHSSVREKEAALVSPTNMIVPQLKTLVTGFTHGIQSPARAELLALLHACEHAIAAEHCVSAEFIVDAQYVINVINKMNNPVIPWHKIANSDIVRKLQKQWSKKQFSLVKVKSHRDIRDATSLSDLWNLLGNHFADAAAGRALNNVPSNFKELIDRVKIFQQKEKAMLRVVFQYFCDLDKARCALLNESKKLNHAENENSQHDNALFEEAILKLSDYRLEHGYNNIQDQLQSHLANANLQGSGLAYAVWWWAEPTSLAK